MKAKQLSLFDFADTPDFVDLCLIKGTGDVNGKDRILKEALKNNDLNELTKFIKNEYGWGGQSCATYSIDYSPKGWECFDNETGENIKLSWKQVTLRILELIANREYVEE